MAGAPDPECAALGSAAATGCDKASRSRPMKRGFRKRIGKR